MLRVATDIGGTFTDLVYVDKEGNIGVGKTHTTPPSFENGILDVIQKLNIDLEDIEAFFHGSTVVINAITERKGVKTGMITTKGFRDILEIARGNRPDLFNLLYEKPTPFIPRHLRNELDERVDVEGNVLKSVESNEIREIVNYFKKENVEAIAIVLLHAYKNPEHEILVKKEIEAVWPEVQITASHELTNEWREYERASTTVLNSYVKPIVSDYIKNLNSKLQGMKENTSKFIMQSNGGITTFEGAIESPINLLESGPVAGVMGAAVLGDMLGEKNIISLDIGGTTAKCSLIDQGQVKVTTDYKIEKTNINAGYPIKVPVVDIVEIGNGGGSIAWNHEGTIKVGPLSAGAIPGPVAYGKGGEEPTTTDANLVTGRLSPNNFDYEVDMSRVKEAIDNKIATPFDLDVDQAALGIIRIANSNMLNALKLISVRKGYDPRDFTLVATGGGGAMHAAALAKELGIKKIIIPVAASVFSAWGMLLTDLRHDYIYTNNKRVAELDYEEFNHNWNLLEEEAYTQYEAEGVKKDTLYFIRHVDMRYAGQEHTVKVPIPAGEITAKEMQQVILKFHDLHEQAYTFKLEESETEIVNVHLIGYGKVNKPALKKCEVNREGKSALKEKREVLFEQDGWLDANVYDRNLLMAGEQIEGPAIIEEDSVSTLIFKNQHAKVDDYGNIIIYLEG